MKKLYAFFLTLFLFSNAFAADYTLSAGMWVTPPGLQNGDVIIIPAGATVFFDFDFTIPQNVTLNIYGNLEVREVTDNGGMNLSTASVINVFTGGRVTSVGAANGSDRIRVGSNVVFKGSDPTVNGPQTATSASSDFDPNTTLPISWGRISLVASTGGTTVNWYTLSESALATFIIERSSNGATWTEVGSKTATNRPGSYSFSDLGRTGRVFYRIVGVDIDGKRNISPVVQLAGEGKAGVKVWNTGAVLYLQLPALDQPASVINVYNTTGQRVHSQQVRLGSGTHSIILPLQKGQYLIQIDAPGGSLYRGKLQW